MNISNLWLSKYWKWRSPNKKKKSSGKRHHTLQPWNDCCFGGNYGREWPILKDKPAFLLDKTAMFEEDVRRIPLQPNCEKACFNQLFVFLPVFQKRDGHRSLFCCPCSDLLELPDYHLTNKRTTQLTSGIERNKPCEAFDVASAAACWSVWWPFFSSLSWWKPPIAASSVETVVPARDGVICPTIRYAV